MSHFNWLELVSMGGYAVTVWSAYACFAGILLINWFNLRRLRQKTIMRILSR